MCSRAAYRDDSSTGPWSAAMVTESDPRGMEPPAQVSRQYRRIVGPGQVEGVDPMGATGRRRSRVVALLVSSAVLLGSAVSAPVGSAAELCSSEPEVFPVADLEPGMMGTAWTVVEGTDPVSFDVEILGVLPDGIAPGVDFILVHTSGAVIDETGGIAAGFSGSPVYIGGGARR